MLAASGMTMMYCSQPNVWPQFENWATKSRDVHVTGGRESLIQMVEILRALITDVEAELFAAKVTEFVNDTNKPGQH
jgi:hypothetical protein